MDGRKLCPTCKGRGYLEAVEVGEEDTPCSTCNGDCFVPADDGPVEPYEPGEI